jgi:hypothetical protein
MGTPAVDDALGVSLQYPFVIPNPRPSGNCFELPHVFIRRMKRHPRAGFLRGERRVHRAKARRVWDSG